MDLYSKPISDVAYADIPSFVEERHPESRILDYESAWIEHPVRVMAYLQSRAAEEAGCLQWAE